MLRAEGQAYTERETQLSTLFVGFFAVGTIITASSSKREKGNSPAPGSANNGSELTRIADVTRFGCAFKEVQLRLQPGETNIWLNS